MIKKFNCAGTMGDTYVILCKLYNLAKKEKIICEHWSGQPKFNSLIKEIYTLLPNIEVSFTDVLCEYPCFSGHFEDKEGYKYNTTFFPNFEFDKPNIDLPKNYTVLQIKSGRPEQKRILKENIINKIISNSNFTIILGTDNLYGSLNSKKVLDLRNKTTIKEAMHIIKNAQIFHGFIGLLGYVGVSCKVFSNIYINKKYDGSSKRLSNIWGKYSKVTNLNKEIKI